MRSFTLLALSACAAGLAQAHVELLFPPPINSKYDPQTPEADKDYSMTSPLLADGSNYPCKGYNTPDKYSSLSPVATLKAGSTFEIEFAAGGATHGGGSCQFSVSYDQGKTFAVIHSVMGGCPISSSYEVPIPSNLPSAKSATFAWTWQNKVGNRELYMNCAIVDIDGGSSTSYSGPGLFRANTFADGTCIVPEGTEVVYPNPGPSPAYGSSITASSPVTTLSNCPYDEDTTVTISPSGSSSSSGGSSSGSSKSSAAAAAPTATSQPVVQRPSSTTTTTTAKATTTTTRAARPVWRDRITSSAPAASSSATTAKASSSSSASATKTQWYLATSASASASASGANLHASASASANPSGGKTDGLTTSAAPSPSPAATGSSSSSGTWIECTSTTTWSLCSSADGCTPMGSVAAGTECRNGAIGLAQSSGRKMVRVRRGTAHAIEATGRHQREVEVKRALLDKVSGSKMKRGVRDHVVARRSH